VGDGSNSPKLMEIAGRAAEGVFCFSNPTVDYLPEAKAFDAAYQKMFKQKPGPYSALSIWQPLSSGRRHQRAGSTDSKAIIKALNETKDFKGIAGPIMFTPEHTLARSNFVTLVVKGGKWALHK
jgi:branched-chain amino acid transport system substrate-binding protein